MANHIVCVPTGVTLGHSRFPKRGDAPQVKKWRCDLTALSRVYNLYFVAYNDAIFVYQPSFPDQCLPAEPEVILRPPVSRPGLCHGIDHYDPHSITRLHLDYLGHEEIVLAACDDGDVIGYRVSQVQYAMDCQSSSPEPNTTRDKESTVRVFFQQNFGASAWGLAIHREARMLAISANTRMVTVVAFALTDRERDWQATILLNHNIPSVAFDNSGNDPDGRWLLSSTIDGSTTLMDLHKVKCLVQYKLGFCASTTHADKAPSNVGVCRCARARDWPHSAWGAMFLDPRAAHEISEGVRARLTVEPAGTAPTGDHHEDESSNTATNVVVTAFDDVSGQMSRFHVGNQTIFHIDRPVSQLEDASEMEIHEEETDDSSNDGSELGSHGPDNDVLIEEDEQEPVVGEEGSTTTDASISQTDMHWLAEVAAGEVGSDTSEEFNYISDTTSPREHSLIHEQENPKPYCEVAISEVYDGQPLNNTPCVFITRQEIYLFQYLLPPERITAIRRPLHPGIWKPFLSSYDRQCFSTQIPELGVFIVASPIGRAAIFSLTQHTEDSTRTYGMRLEYILPFCKGNDREVCRPLADATVTLMGVAVGPVQGMFDEPDGHSDAVSSDAPPRDRKWRLMMHFTDHTVLSYELSKRRKGESCGLGDVVV